MSSAAATRLRSFDQSRKVIRTAANGRPVRSDFYFGDGHADTPGPEIFRVNFPTGHQSRAHFHPVDQFQIFLGTAGATYQRHEIPELLVHYADAYTTYGPFGAGSDVLSFFTFRSMASSFTAFMPESRHRLVRRGIRHLEADLSEVALDDVTRDEVLTTDVIERHPDGLAAALITAGAGARFPAPDTDGTGGQAYYVVAGEIALGGEHYGAQSCGWGQPGAPRQQLTVVGDGTARVVVLSFPLPR
jgi:hypothetical protein